jgi:hypothetical protein
MTDNQKMREAQYQWWKTQSNQGFPDTPQARYARYAFECGFQAGAAWQAAQPVQVDEGEWLAKKLAVWMFNTNYIDLQSWQVEAGRNAVLHLQPYLRTPQQPQPVSEVDRLRVAIALTRWRKQKKQAPVSKWEDLTTAEQIAYLDQADAAIAAIQKGTGHDE